MQVNWFCLTPPSFYSWTERRLRRLPPRSLSTTPSLIPQAGGLTAALQRAAEQTNTDTLEWAVTGIPSNYSLPGLWRYRKRSGFRHQSSRRITPPAAGDPGQHPHHIPRTSVSQREGLVAKGEVRRKAGGSVANRGLQGGEGWKHWSLRSRVTRACQCWRFPWFSGWSTICSNSCRCPKPWNRMTSTPGSGRTSQCPWCTLCWLGHGPWRGESPSKHLSVSTGTPLSIHSPHAVFCECLCACLCVRAAVVTVCGSQEKKAMFRQGERCGWQWHLMVGREMAPDHMSNTLPLSLFGWISEEQPFSQQSSSL